MRNAPGAALKLHWTLSIMDMNTMKSMKATRMTNGPHQKITQTLSEKGQRRVCAKAKSKGVSKKIKSRAQVHTQPKIENAPVDLRLKTKAGRT